MAAGWGSLVQVKNTFLDLDDECRASTLELRRNRSEPARGPPVESDSDSEDEGTEAPPTSAGEYGGAGDDGADDSDIPPPPPGDTEELSRVVTLDGYEDAGYWQNWARGGNPEIQMPPVIEAEPEVETTAVAAAPATPVASGLPYATPAQGAPFTMPQGIVMVPFFPNMAPAPAIAMPFHVPVPPGHQMVPVSFCQRWPEGLPAPPPEAPVLPRDVGSDEGSASEPPQTTPSRTVAPRAPVLQRVFSVNSQVFRIRWTVDAKKLKSTDRETVSPSFELQFAVPVQFKMVIRSKVVAAARGCASFKKAKGRGSVILRCLAEEHLQATVHPVVRFRIAIGNSRWMEQPRGPVDHNFAQRATCGLPEHQEEWDFQKVVDEDSQTFVVCLEVLAGGSG